MQPNFAIIAYLAIACSVKVFCAGVVDRPKRTLVYTSDSATGILIALSVPLLIPDRNIFLAYNFEANYGMPGKASDFTQGVLKKVDNDQIHPAPEGEGEESERAVRATVTNFTRKQVYRMIELNLMRYGYNGKKCILRMICEMARHPVYDANGLVGDLMQLVFTKSRTSSCSSRIAFVSGSCTPVKMSSSEWTHSGKIRSQGAPLRPSCSARKYSLSRCSDKGSVVLEGL
uniref:Uncharacterized protein n=1 Tax=Anopheles culicifacies TaxID=139723 RepID=A0A182MK84_9DIPT